MKDKGANFFWLMAVFVCLVLTACGSLTPTRKPTPTLSPVVCKVPTPKPILPPVPTFPIGRETAVKTLTPMLIKPSGYWLSPNWCKVVKDFVVFKARAFPTNQHGDGDPPIDHVNFTWNILGNWSVACSASKIDPGTTDEYSCMASLSAVGEKRGLVKISFDVYDKKGNINKAPNGERDIVYDPLAA